MVGAIPSFQSDLSQVFDLKPVYTLIEAVSCTSRLLREWILLREEVILWTEKTWSTAVSH